MRVYAGKKKPEKKKNDDSCRLLGLLGPANGFWCPFAAPSLHIYTCLTIISALPLIHLS